MAFGDMISVQTTVASGEFLTIQPASGIGWTLHNFYANPTTDVELYRSDGTTDTLIYATKGSFMSYQYHANNIAYFKFKNVSGVSASLGYDGVVTQVV